MPLGEHALVQAHANLRGASQTPQQQLLAQHTLPQTKHSGNIEFNAITHRVLLVNDAVECTFHVTVGAKRLSDATHQLTS